MNRVLTEPYRLLFPLGILAGTLGVALWPLLYAESINFYPADAHTRIMTQGFIGAFILGFLGTSFPRLVEAPSLSLPEWLVILPLWAAGVLCAAWNEIAIADVLFVLAIVHFLGALMVRWAIAAKDTPPPGFLLALIGLALGLTAALALAVGEVIDMSMGMRNFWKLCLYQGFPLLPIMGVAPYLLPRFLGHSTEHHFDTSRTPPPGWWPIALRSLTLGALLITTFVMEAAGWPATGQIARSLVILLWFLVDSPIFRPAPTPSTLGNALRWVAFSVTTGWVCAALFPYARVGSLHLVLVSGFGLLTLVVASRVVLGHAGRHDLLPGKRVWVRWLIALAVIASTTRMSSDFLPKVKDSHYIYAAITWIITYALWFWMLRPFFFQSDEKDDDTPPSPKKGRTCRKARHRTKQETSPEVASSE